MQKVMNKSRSKRVRSPGYVAKTKAKKYVLPGYIANTKAKSTIPQGTLRNQTQKSLISQDALRKLCREGNIVDSDCHELIWVIPYSPGTTYTWSFYY